MATGFLSKINFLFAITKMLQGQGIEPVLEKYNWLPPTGHNGAVPCAASYKWLN